MSIKKDFQNLLSLFSQDELNETIPKIDKETFKEKLIEFSLSDTETFYFSPQISKKHNHSGFAKFKDKEIIEVQVFKTNLYGDTKIFAYNSSEEKTISINYNLMKELIFDEKI